MTVGSGSKLNLKKETILVDEVKLSVSTKAVAPVGVQLSFHPHMIDNTAINRIRKFQICLYNY
jgi:hypothetical protein